MRSELPANTDSAAPSDVTPAPQLGSLLVRALWAADGLPAAGIGFDLHPSGVEDFYRDSTRHETNAAGRQLYDKLAKHHGFIVYAQEL